tara:strand:- start:4224 stop:4616 length:393 start_codon:yes stop_codon:yes gene_type:complete
LNHAISLAALISASLFLPVAATANAFVNGPRGCDFLDGFDDYGPLYTVDEDHLVLSQLGLEGIEWNCTFNEPFEPYLEDGEIEIRTGYCMEPGPFITPAVFTLLERGDGTVQLDASDWSDPLILDICPAP